MTYVVLTPGGQCPKSTLPDLIEHGRYSPVKDSYLDFEVLEITCDDGYAVKASTKFRCRNGTFTEAPKCVRKGDNKLPFLITCFKTDSCYKVPKVLKIKAFQLLMQFPGKVALNLHMC